MELSLIYSSLLVLKEAESNDEPSADGRLIRIGPRCPPIASGSEPVRGKLVFSISLG